MQEADDILLMTCTGSRQVQDPDLRDSAEREDVESGAAAHRGV